MSGNADRGLDVTDDRDVYSSAEDEQQSSDGTDGEAYEVVRVWLDCPNCKRRLGRARVGSEVELRCRHCSARRNAPAIFTFKI